MKKIITTLTAITFALGLAAAAQAQVAKTPEPPAVQATPAQVAPKDVVKTGDKAKETTKPGEKVKAKSKDKKEVKKVTAEQKPGAPLEKTPEGTK